MTSERIEQKVKMNNISYSGNTLVQKSTQMYSKRFQTIFFSLLNHLLIVMDGCKVTMIFKIQIVAFYDHADLKTVFRHNRISTSQ